MTAKTGTAVSQPVTRILININRMKKHFTILGTVLLLTSGFVDVSQAGLTASTSLTVVHVTDFLHGSADITTWGGAWPQPPVTPDTATDLGSPQGQEVYLNDVFFTTHSIKWNTYPYRTPYPPFPNGLSSMICAVWSLDGGKTFKLQSWDYLTPTRHDKGLEEGMPNCWMGSIVHSLCDRKADECNGRNRTNLYFSEFPSGSTGCWGSAVMK
ncbi:MAG: hypothetical protein KJ990_00860 [Proteobacteria bacterium]|nr:hypothetical protein [Pseudomonadota bacterium]MBU1648848.1 hypothetical protein [Pseudomonadota bacterium]MBU1985999.1 hypothetical protein [Pseudomonadota bacterium]